MKFKIGILTALITLSSFYVFSQKTQDNVNINFTENTFYIKCVANGKYLDLPGYASNAKKNNGANVQLWDMDNGNDRKIKFIPAGNGYYYINFQHANVNLDVHGCYDGKYFCGTYKKDKGANVQIWSAGTSKPQQWKIVQVTIGKFKIINRYSGKVLDASASNINKNGCNVQQWTWHGKDNQLWEIIDVKSKSKYHK